MLARAQPTEPPVRKRLTLLTIIYYLQSWPLTVQLKTPFISSTRSYLTERKQHVKVNYTCSDWKFVKHGVPRGSILCLVLFNLFLNDVNLSDQITPSLRSHTDDTNSYSSSICPSTLQVNLQDSLSLLTIWFRKNV